jgi:pimeloyl-ACP methyl ester carboxylesterase
LYVNHFARLFPDLVGGIVLIDPVSPDNDRFRKELPSPVFQRSGVDKVRALRILTWLNGFGFTRLMKSAVLKSYWRNGKNMVPPETLDILWHHVLLPHGPKTAFAEYLHLQNQVAREDLKSSHGFPQVPLKVITHSSERMIEQIARYGRLTAEHARMVETLWQELIRAHLELSPQSSLIVAEGSDHNVHLDEPQLVIRTILELVEEVKQPRNRKS